MSSRNMHQRSSRKAAKIDSASKSIMFKCSSSPLVGGGLLVLASSLLLITLGANRAQALSLISEKCDPNKVGPDETTVKGGWQAEMFNGLAFRACGK